MKTLSGIILSILVATLPLQALASSTRDQAEFSTPKRANYFLQEVTPDKYDALATFDLLILPAELQEYNPSAFTELRKRNPDIILLAYVPSISYNTSKWFDALHAGLLARIPADWWIKDTSGNTLSIWPGTMAISPTSTWQYLLPQYVAHEIMATGLWSGVFYDEFSSTIPPSLATKNIDIMKDGQPDDLSVLNAAWKNAAATILSYTRELLGPKAIIITNGDSDPAFTPYVNGRMFESFPTPWEGAGAWKDTVASYARLDKTVGAKPAINIINGTTGDTGNYADLADMRFALTTTLLGDGYFSYDFGETNHGQIDYTYTEELTRIGSPIGKMTNLFNPAQKTITAGVWYRAYRNATVFVNSTTKSVTISLVKNKYINANGKTLTTITIPANDGVILMKK